MAAVESALVPLAAHDSLDAIITKVRAAGATNVDLLVPDGTVALQSLGGFERLRQAIEPPPIQLLVISSDEQTLDAARQSKIETLGVQGARVVSPTVANSGDTLPSASLPQRADTVDKRDAAFLSALDEVRPSDRYADLEEDDADLYSALDDLSDAIQQSGPSSRRSGGAGDDRGYGGDEEFAAALDEWSDPDVSQQATRPAQRPDRAPERRFSAADFDLDDDTSTRAPRGRRSEAKLGAGGAIARRPRAAVSGRLRGYDDEEAAAPRRARYGGLIALAVVLLLVLALAYWFLTSRATITVSPPTNVGSQHPFKNEVIPHAQLTDTSSTAVKVQPVSADAEGSATGTIDKETLSPVGTAKGEVTVINTIGSAVPIPKGAEFVGKNAKGEDVRFMVDNDITVPGATTSTSLSGTSTTYGQATIAVTARSPGSDSNVGPNTLTQLLIPGQQPLVSQNSNFIFQNAEISGGSEEPQRIVTEADVQAVLGVALSNLYANGGQQLVAKIDPTKAGIDALSITPTSTDLADPANYEAPVVVPPIGQPVNPSSPTFTVTVRAHFNALATPAQKSVSDQLGEVVRNYFAQRGSTPCKANETPAQQVDAWHWDGEKLTIDGAINCLPPQTLSPEVLGQVRDAVRGQQRDAAEAGLRLLQQQGTIGTYQLPNKAAFPGFDWLITVETTNAPPAESQPTGAPQPTQGTP